MEELAADFPPGSQGVAHLVLTFQPCPIGKTRGWAGSGGIPFISMYRLPSDS